jgi:hypothetical protein
MLPATGPGVLEDRAGDNADQGGAAQDVSDPAEHADLVAKG